MKVIGPELQSVAGTTYIARVVPANDLRVRSVSICDEEALLGG